MPTIGVMSTASPRLVVLKCISVGAPGEITWTYSGSSRMYTNDGSHQIIQSLLNGTTSTLESQLTFIRHPYQIDTGEHACIITSTFVSTNSSQTNTSTVIGMYIHLSDSL